MRSRPLQDLLLPQAHLFVSTASAMQQDIPWSSSVVQQ